jgi:S1-C subfamily serine protease
MFKYLCSLLIGLTILFESHASLWDKLRERGLVPGKEYTISSGTGFYINDRYIITNEHVVQNCINISIRGPVNPSPAYLYATDPTTDLAVISTETKPKLTAILRADTQNLSLGEQMIVIGYPLNSAENGHFTYTPALVETIKTDHNQLTEIEFNAPIEHGNSGGPLIDLSGNVVGVVQARKSYFIDTQKLNLAKNTNIEFEKPFKVNGVAIGLSILENFLAKNNILYKTQTSNAILQYHNSQQTAQNYIVNIHCVKK